MSKVPYCTSTKGRKSPIARKHPGYKRFEKRYPTVQDWIDAHPNTPFANVLQAPEEVFYCSYWSGKLGIIFTAFFEEHRIPPRATVYENYQAWLDAQKEEQ